MLQQVTSLNPKAFTSSIDPLTPIREFEIQRQSVGPICFYKTISLEDQIHGVSSISSLLLRSSTLYRSLTFTFGPWPIYNFRTPSDYLLRPVTLDYKNSIAAKIRISEIFSSWKQTVYPNVFARRLPEKKVLKTAKIQAVIFDPHAERPPLNKIWYIGCPPNIDRPRVCGGQIFNASTGHRNRPYNLSLSYVQTANGNCDRITANVSLL